MIDYRELTALERDDLLDIAEGMNDRQEPSSKRMASLFDNPVTRD